MKIIFQFFSPMFVLIFLHCTNLRQLQYLKLASASVLNLFLNLLYIILSQNRILSLWTISLIHKMVSVCTFLGKKCKETWWHFHHKFFITVFLYTRFFGINDVMWRQQNELQAFLCNMLCLQNFPVDGRWSKMSEIQQSTKFLRFSIFFMKFLNMSSLVKVFEIPRAFESFHRILLRRQTSFLCAVIVHNFVIFTHH